MRCVAFVCLHKSSLALSGVLVSMQRSMQPPGNISACWCDVAVSRRYRFRVNATLRPDTREALLRTKPDSQA
jgi:hypothetical protein